MVKTRKLGVPLIASLLIAGGVAPALADSSFDVCAPGACDGTEVARGKAAVSGSAGADSSTGDVRADHPDDGGVGSRSASTTAEAAAGAASTSASSAVTNTDLGANASGSGEILLSDGLTDVESGASISLLRDQTLVAGGVEARSFGGTGAITALSLASFGEFAADAGVQTSLTDPVNGVLASSSSAILSNSLTGDFRISSIAFESVGPFAPLIETAVFPPVREFDVNPMLATSAFSQSLIDRTGGDFTAFSEAWKGRDSGDAETVTSAETADSHTLAASGLDAEDDNVAFSQAFSAPDGADAQFASATAESQDGGAAYSSSTIARRQGEIDNGDGTTAPFTTQTAIAIGAIEGNGVIEVEALAANSFSENSINDQFDGETLTGVAEVVSSVLTPAAEADTFVRVEGDGTIVNRTVSNSIDLVDSEGVLAATSFVSNEVNLDQNLRDNVIIETGDNHAVLLSDVGKGIQGLLNINQDAGNTNNQANIRSIAITDKENTVLLNDVSGKVSTTGNRVTTNGTDRSNTITDGSFAGGNGIVGVNQSSGSANQMTNVLALAVGIGDNAVSIGDVDLEIEHSDNELVETAPGNRTDRIDGGAFDGFNGVAQVNQVSGDLNQVTGVIAVSVSVQ